MSKSFLFIVLLLLIVGCSPRVLERVEVHTDTCYVHQVRRDSVVRHDSIYIHEFMKNDTVFLERVRLQRLVQERLRVDTLFVSRSDTVVRTRIEYRNKPLSGWQQFQIWHGRIFLVLLAGAIAYAVWKIRP